VDSYRAGEVFVRGNPIEGTNFDAGPWFFSLSRFSLGDCFYKIDSIETSESLLKNQGLESSSHRSCGSRRFLGGPIRELSGGEKKSAALPRELVMERPVLFLDENV